MNNILVIRFSSIGDIILTEPVVRTLQSTYPDARMAFLTKQQYLPLLKMFEPFDRSYGWIDDRLGVELLLQLKDQRFDLIVDLHNNIRSARVRTALGVKSVKAKKEWFKRILAVKLSAIGGKPSHALKRYFSALGDLNIPHESLAPRLIVPDDDRGWWQEFRRRNDELSDYYVIAAGATHATKKAPDELWLALHHAAVPTSPTKAILAGSPGERDYLAQLAKVLGLDPRCIIAEEDICRAAAVLESARYVISNDSGLAHLAAAVGTPVVALFGPTHPVLGFAPLGDRADSYTVDEYCSPCSLHGDRKCFRAQRFCFTRMNAEAILARVEPFVRR
jgi:ADP-heptose:LPS heptosyltransferase